jgi:hypothetical protein
MTRARDKLLTNYKSAMSCEKMSNLSDTHMQRMRRTSKIDTLRMHKGRLQDTGVDLSGAQIFQSRDNPNQAFAVKET